MSCQKKVGTTAKNLKKKRKKKQWEWILLKWQIYKIWTLNIPVTGRIFNCNFFTFVFIPNFFKQCNLIECTQCVVIINITFGLNCFLGYYIIIYNAFYINSYLNYYLLRIFISCRTRSLVTRFFFFPLNFSVNDKK